MQLYPQACIACRPVDAAQRPRFSAVDLVPDGGLAAEEVDPLPAACRVHTGPSQPISLSALTRSRGLCEHFVDSVLEDEGVKTKRDPKYSQSN